MNKAQRKVLVAGLVVALAMVVFPPWVCKGVQKDFTPEQKTKYGKLSTSTNARFPIKDVYDWSFVMDRYKPAPTFRELARLPAKKAAHEHPARFTGVRDSDYYDWAYSILNEYRPIFFSSTAQYIETSTLFAYTGYLDPDDDDERMGLKSLNSFTYYYYEINLLRLLVQLIGLAFATGIGFLIAGEGKAFFQGSKKPAAD